MANDTLDQRIWDGETLRSDVAIALMKIAKAFLDKTEIDKEPDDVIFVGSAAGYNYGPTSDIDLHIVMDMSKVSDDVELAKAFFNAEKVSWNLKHNITVKGRDVEVYVQDIDDPLESTAMYSVLNGAWIKKQPKSLTAAAPKDTEARARAISSMWAKKAKEYIIASKPEGIEKSIDLIYSIRKRGLERGGEMDPMNLAFKRVRSAGLLDALKLAKDGELDRFLSVESDGNSVYNQRDPVYDPASNEDMIMERGQIKDDYTPEQLAEINEGVADLIERLGLGGAPVTEPMTAEEVLARLGMVPDAA